MLKNVIHQGHEIIFPNQISFTGEDRKATLQENSVSIGPVSEQVNVHDLDIGSHFVHLLQHPGWVGVIVTMCEEYRILIEGDERIVIPVEDAL